MCGGAQRQQGPSNVLGRSAPLTTRWSPLPPALPQVLFINTILGLLWPHLSPAIHKTVMQQAKAPLEDVCKQVRLPAAAGQGGAGAEPATGMAGPGRCPSPAASRAPPDTWPSFFPPLHKQAKVLQEIRIDRLDLGTRPPRMDCFKSYETTEDELIVEVGGGVCDAWVASPPPPTHTTTTPLVYGCSVGGEAGRPRGSCLLLMRVPGTATHPALHLVVGCAAHARPTPPPADSGLLGRRHASARDGGCEGGGAHH
jgi:hypothetical protein